jgi:holo-[acyl-carrier protein] synthase
VTPPAEGVDSAGVRGIGVDAVDVGRFRRAIERRPALVDRLFTPAERAYAERSRDPGPRLAARFAAKEAAWKALGVGVGAVGFQDVEVVRSEGGAPGLSMSGRAASLAARRGVRRWHVSLTHTDTLAVASVVAVGPAGDPDMTVDDTGASVAHFDTGSGAGHGRG